MLTVLPGRTVIASFKKQKGPGRFLSAMKRLDAAQNDPVITPVVYSLNGTSKSSKAVTETWSSAGIRPIQELEPRLSFPVDYADCERRIRAVREEVGQRLLMVTEDVHREVGSLSNEVAEPCLL